MSWTRVSSSRSNSVVVSPSTPLAPRRFICRQVSTRNAGVSKCANDVKRSVRSAFALAAICSSCVDIRFLLLSVGDVSLAQRLDLRRRFPLCAAFPRAECRVGGGASHDAGLRPPLKLHVQFSRMQLSRKRGGTPRGQRRDQANQAHQPQLAAQTPNGEGLPPRTAPSPESMRPQASFDPTIELVEESPYVGALIVLTPSANHRIEFANQLRRRMRDATLIRELNPVIRGWGEYYKRAHVRRLFNQLDGWVERRLWSHRFRRWRCPGWKVLPTARLRGELGLVSLIGLIPSLAPRPRAALS